MQIKSFHSANSCSSARPEGYLKNTTPTREHTKNNILSTHPHTGQSKASCFCVLLLFFVSKGKCVCVLCFSPGVSPVWIFPGGSSKGYPIAKLVLVAFFFIIASSPVKCGSKIEFFLPPLHVSFSNNSCSLVQDLLPAAVHR